MSGNALSLGSAAWLDALKRVASSTFCSLRLGQAETEALHFSMRTDLYDLIFLKGGMFQPRTLERLEGLPFKAVQIAAPCAFPNPEGLTAGEGLLIQLELPFPSRSDSEGMEWVLSGQRGKVLVEYCSLPAGGANEPSTSGATSIPREGACRGNSS